MYEKEPDDPSHRPVAFGDGAAHLLFPLIGFSEGFLLATLGVF
jgi:hypothetical protein